MDESELLHRYALVLSLVPDGDAAADIFMEARAEDDLRRRARRWRTANGLPPEAPPGPLPPLDEDQREHALHLARRAKLRRSTRPWLVFGAAAVVVCAAVAAGQALHWSPRVSPAGGGAQSGARAAETKGLQPLTVEARGGRPVLTEGSCGNAVLVRSRRGEPLLVLTVPYSATGPLPQVASAVLHPPTVAERPGRMYVDVRADKAQPDSSACYLLLSAVELPEGLQGKQVDFSVTVRPGRMAAGLTFTADAVWVP